MKKTLMVGAFDIIHPGHIQAIKEAKKLGDNLVVVLGRDRNLLKLKGQLPYYNEKTRLNNLKKLNLADKVVLGDMVDKLKIIKEEKPAIIALGYDQYPAKELWHGIKGLGIKTTRLNSFKSEIFKSSKLKKIFADSRAGFLNIDKPIDWTSHDIVAKLRTIIKIKQIGHAGTLDPFATGVLICGLGSATKMMSAFHLLPKTYEAIIKLGVVSDTYDRTGKITNYQSLIINKLSITNLQIKKILKTFIGKQKQLPPMYSAKKVNGKKLYELAREGKIIERPLSEVEIYDLKLLTTEDSTLKIRVKCSAGTYIRTLTHDIGEKLGTGAVLWELKRTAIGSYQARSAVLINKIKKQDYQKFIIKPERVLLGLNKQYL